VWMWQRGVDRGESEKRLTVTVVLDLISMGPWSFVCWPGMAHSAVRNRKLWLRQSSAA